MAKLTVRRTMRIFDFYDRQSDLVSFFGTTNITKAELINGLDHFVQIADFGNNDLKCHIRLDGARDNILSAPFASDDNQTLFCKVMGKISYLLDKRFGGMIEA